MNRFLVFIIILIVISRLAAVVFLHQKQISVSPVQDPLEYRNLAVNILRGNSFSMAQNTPYVPDLLRTPAYPAFLSLTFLFDEAGYLAVFLQQIMLIASAWMLWAMLRRFRVYKAISLFFSIILLAEPRLWFWSLETMTEALFIFLIMLSVFFLIYPEVIRAKHIVGSAFAFGLTLLTRPSGLLWAAGFMIFSALYEAPLKKKIFASVCFIIIVVAIVSPWVWRNYQLTGRLILSSSQEINYALGFQKGPNEVTSGCAGFIRDSKGREVCMFRSFTSEGFNDVEILAKDLRGTTSFYSFLKRNIIGAYYLWVPNDYKDIISIARNSIFGSSGDLSGGWLFFANISYRAYSLFLIVTGILALAGFAFLYENGKYSVAGLFGGIIFFSTLINFGIAGGRHHLILLPAVLFLAGLGLFYATERLYRRLG